MGTGNAYYINHARNTLNRLSNKPTIHWLFAFGVGCCLFLAYLAFPTHNNSSDSNALSSSLETPSESVQYVYQYTDGSPTAFNPPQQTFSSPVPNAQDAQVTASIVEPQPEKHKLAAPQPHLALDKDAPIHVQSIVRTGDSLFKIFARLGLSHSTLDKIVSSYNDPSSPLRYIYPGQTIDFKVEKGTNDLVSFAFNKDRLTKVIIARDQKGNFTVSEHSRIQRVETTFAEGHIEGAFYLAAKKAGLSDKTILQFADIFAWDIDFTQDIREGDAFQVVYELNHLEDNTTEPGQILTAHFTNRGKPISAIAYTDPSGKTSYYTPEGNSMRKAFLRSPVDFARISSHFDLQRRHPVLHTIRAHKGVDYAAKRGTPVKATGDGKVIFKGRKGGYGRVVILEHGQKYSTLYAHLQGFAKKLNVGDRIQQNEVIGFIGSSGLATGPHLHYEFRVNNVHKNPLTVKFPNAAPVSQEYRAAFMKVARQRLAQLDEMRQTTVASTKPNAEQTPDG